MTVLVLTPNDDTTSQTAGSWGAKLASAYSLSLLVTTSRSKVDAEIVRHEHMLYFGHGTVDALVATPKMFRTQIDLVDAANTCGGVTVAVACLSADSLGPTTTSRPSTADAFLGWRNKMSWPPKAPEPIGDAIYDGLEVLMTGGTIGDTQTELQLQFDVAHERYGNDGPAIFGLTSGEVQLAQMQATYWKDRMRLSGNSSARL